MGNGTPSGSAGPTPKDKTPKAETCVTVKSNSLSGNKLQHTDKAFCLDSAAQQKQFYLLRGHPACIVENKQLR